MDTIPVSKDHALKVYNDQDAAGKILLEHLLGRQNLITDIRERVKSFEDACGVLGLAVSDILNGYDTADESAYKKIKTMVAALRGDWVPDYSDSNQKKWFPYFVWDKATSGFRFHVATYGYTSASTSGGSRLCLPTEELAIHLGKIAISHFNQFLK
jgi:hypothetical protein